MKNKEIYEYLLKKIEKGFYQVKDGHLYRKGKRIGSKAGAGYIGYTIKGKTIYAHRILYAYYHGLESLVDGMVINHIDENKMNNKRENLEQVTKQENITRQWRNNSLKRGSSAGNSRLTEKDVIEIKELLKNGLTQREIGEKYSVSRAAINNIAMGTTWKHVSKQSEINMRHLKELHEGLKGNNDQEKGFLMALEALGIEL
jgi:hypothetical protein